MKLSELMAIAPHLPADTEVNLGTVGGAKRAHWEVWPGWAGNHDQRIEDATCSNCGYVHPTTVYGSLSKLPRQCVSCKSEMSTNGS